VEHFLKISDELTVDDIMILAQKVLSSPLTMACSEMVLPFFIFRPIFVLFTIKFLNPIKFRVHHSFTSLIAILQLTEFQIMIL